MAVTVPSLESETRRFAFGQNWTRFLEVLDESRIEIAEKSLKHFLGLEQLEGKRFFDVGSGSGLFSLAAYRLGAQVVSIDYDRDSVQCTQTLRDQHQADHTRWSISQGSILDREAILSLGSFDIGYCWGVLHHTGSLWQAIHNMQESVSPGGLLYLGIYNHQGLISETWRLIKQCYCSGWLGRFILKPIFYSLFFLAGLAIDLVQLRDPRRRYREFRKYRGMSLTHDWNDWLGGYPYDPARPQEVIAYLENLGWTLKAFEPTGHGFGNNQFVFQKAGGGPA